MNVNDLIGGLVDIVEDGPDFEVVTYGILLYFAALWFVFSAWVFFDAFKRYSNFFIALVWFLGVLVGLPPMLIFYLIVRPEHFDHEGHLDDTAVNIPMVNFVSSRGVDMSIQLSISDHLIREGHEAEQINLGISLDGDNLTEATIDSLEVAETPKEEDETSMFSGISNFFSGIATKFKESVASMRNSMSREEDTDVENDSEEEPEDSEEDTNTDEENEESITEKIDKVIADADSNDSKNKSDEDKEAKLKKNTRKSKKKKGK